MAAIAAIGDAEHALDRAHRAADAGTNGATDHAADRTGDPVTFVRTLSRAPHDALGMTEAGDRKQRKNDGGGREDEPHGKAGREGRGLNLGFVHPDSLKRSASAVNLKRPCGQMVAHL
jgi:hypothetical protein